MRALELYRSIPRYIASRAVSGRFPGLVAGPVAPLRLVDKRTPELPGPGWARVRTLLAGICGSDLTTLSGKSSFYFSAVVSLPFIPGHEVVGELLDDAGELQAGQRVVIDPLLACATRGVDPCGPCQEGNPAGCERLSAGHLGPGLQTGYCTDAPGGWSETMLAHSSQMHAVPKEVTDEAAVMVEPMACALHAVERAKVPRDATVLIIGAGTVGLLTLIALRESADAGKVIVVAKHEHQRELATQYGASEVVSPGRVTNSVRRATTAFRLDPERSAPFLLGGADVAFEATGSRSGLDTALRSTSARGRVVLSGMPAGADLTPAWFRELDVTGAYSGAGRFPDAMRLAAMGELGKLVGPAYPLSGWREAIDHALGAGKLGATKIVFDPRLDE